MEKNNSGKRNNESFDTKEYYRSWGKLIFHPKEEDYPKFMLQCTDKFVRCKLTNMTKTQMRNVFDLIKNCESAEELQMTKPKLLYTAGRLSGEPRTFLVKLSELVVNADKKENVEQFQKFIETILAYHKYYGKN